MRPLEGPYIPMGGPPCEPVGCPHRGEGLYGPLKGSVSDPKTRLLAVLTVPSAAVETLVDCEGKMSIIRVGGLEICRKMHKKARGAANAVTAAV